LQQKINEISKIYESMNELSCPKSHTTFAKEKGLQGVMTWDANNDGKGCDGNAPYAYSIGIQRILSCIMIRRSQKKVLYC
jgi:GH18 family chitinase